MLKVRKEGWPEWIELFDLPITEKVFPWDTTAFPSGIYRVKLLASDRPSNSPDETLLRDRESVTFVIDHDAPTVKVTPEKSGAAIELKDELTRLVKADYSLDGGHWVSFSPTTACSTRRAKRSQVSTRLAARDALADGTCHRFRR